MDLTEINVGTHSIEMSKSKKKKNKEKFYRNLESKNRFITKRHQQKKFRN